MNSTKQSHFSMLETRLARLRKQLADAEIDALLISQPENRAYLSGFTGSAGWLVVTQDGARIATDFRYFEQVALECPHFELTKIESTFSARLPGIIADLGIHRLGFEADHATFADVQDWSAAAPDCEWSATRSLIGHMRAIKDRYEAQLLRDAVRLADDALADTLPRIRTGMTERDVAWCIESYFRTHGADGVSFETIVSCGPNGARPHARAGDTLIRSGEPIVIDMGARLHGYCSDLTRTVCLGEPNDPEKFWLVYDTVLKAQQAAEAGLRPGLSGIEGDALARQVIVDAGFGENFGHGLGHGVGMVVHEEPRLSPRSATPLETGHFVTVEPGIYLPGWGGVRIEDLVEVTGLGIDVLSQASKDPILPGR